MAAVLNDYESAPIDASWKALFECLAKICRQSSAVTQEDIDRAKAAGWSDEALYDAFTVCALFQFYNTWIDATGVQDMPVSSYEMMGKRLAERGYAF